MYNPNTKKVIINCDVFDEEKFWHWSSRQLCPATNFSDYAGDLNDRKSTFGYVFMIGSGAISWSQEFIVTTLLPLNSSKIMFFMVESNI